jgi:hypothetical protein
VCGAPAVRAIFPGASFKIYSTEIVIVFIYPMHNRSPIALKLAFQKARERISRRREITRLSQKKTPPKPHNPTQP